MQADLSATMRLDEGALNTLAKRAFPLDAGVLVLVGDKGVILKQMQGLGLPEAVELSAIGEAPERARCRECFRNATTTHWKPVPPGDEVVAALGSRLDVAVGFLH